jgi:hypothetical protein
MHIIFSEPRKTDQQEPGLVGKAEAVSQFILLGMVIIMCFYQPAFLTDMINQSIAGLIK